MPPEWVEAKRRAPATSSSNSIHWASSLVLAICFLSTFFANDYCLAVIIKSNKLRFSLAELALCLTARRRQGRLRSRRFEFLLHSVAAQEQAAKSQGGRCEESWGKRETCFIIFNNYQRLFST